MPADGPLKRAVIGDVPALVGKTPRLELDRRSSLEQELEPLQELDERKCALRTATYVERSARKLVDAIAHHEHGVDQIVDEEDVADLSTVAVDRDVLPTQRANEKVREPSLVFVAELARPI